MICTYVSWGWSETIRKAFWPVSGILVWDKISRDYVINGWRTFWLSESYRVIRRLWSPECASTIYDLVSAYLVSDYWLKVSPISGVEPALHPVAHIHSTTPGMLCYYFWSENFFRRAKQNFCGYWIRLTRNARICNARSGKVDSSHCYLDGDRYMR